ncbi:spermidine synthase [Microvirga sp. BT688]|uniref:spermidine synthase n=1 Tax=Microvirga sp. TaxID=1873136 RepID=UPI001686C2A5|nr:spermidine synthase [Microvirga sp.]MBD2751030.1 spermidine synthase [Microvirga sp.]
MSALFEELDYCPTPMGVLSLRRRRDLVSGGDIYEIKLDDEFLMSSLFTASEIALARLGLASLSGTSLDVIVGGLGLGYTARAVLEHAQVGSLLVVDTLAEVIEWHQRGLLPLGAELTADPRCRLVLGDFFGGAASETGFDADQPGRRYHAILVDIDHSPKNVLHPSHAALYTVDGLTRLAAHLHPGGVFALWSNDPLDDEFQQALGEVFATSEAHIIAFDNMRQDGEVTNTVYVATRGR